MTVELTSENEEELHALSRQMGKSVEQLVNEAVAQWAPAAAVRGRDWKASWRRTAGMWKDRDDLDVDAIRRSWR